MCCGECGVLWGVRCVVRSVVGCEECGGLWRVHCVVGSAVRCEECGGLWKVWFVEIVVCFESCCSSSLSPALAAMMLSEANSLASPYSRCLL